MGGTCLLKPYFVDVQTTARVKCERCLCVRVWMWVMQTTSRDVVASTVSRIVPIYIERFVCVRRKGTHLVGWAASFQNRIPHFRDSLRHNETCATKFDLPISLYRGLSVSVCIFLVKYNLCECLRSVLCIRMRPYIQHRQSTNERYIVLLRVLFKMQAA